MSYGMKMPWRRLIIALIFGGSIVFFHWMSVNAADNFVVVRPYKSGYAEVNPGSFVADENGLIIPMPDGSREVVSQGEVIGHKVFTYGFPFSYRTSDKQLPMCTPRWQIPVRITLNILFFAAICFAILGGFSAMRTLKAQPTTGSNAN
jgi:hypothetical protein